jgi:hypothetical protein
VKRAWIVVGAAAAIAETAIVWAYRAEPSGALRVAAMAGVAATLAATWAMARRPPAVGVGRALRVILFGVVAFFVAICARPFRGDLVAHFGALALAFVTILLARSRADAGAGAAGRVEVVATNLCLILIGIEGALELAARVRPSPLLTQFGSDAGVYVESIRPKPHLPRPGPIPYNAWGEYDVEPAAKKPGECLAVTIGDSFSAGIVPHPYHFTTVAERALGGGCQIYNMGIAKIGPREYKYLLQKEALGLHPDVIVIDLFIGNDIVDDYGCNPSPLRKWLDRENLLVYVVPRRLWAWARERGRAGGAATVGVPQLDAAWASGMPWLTDPLAEQPSFSPEAYADIESRHVMQLCSADAERYDDDFFRALDELVRAAGTTRLAFMMIPDELQVEDALWNDLTRDVKVPLERDRGQRVVGAWLRARGLPVLDLLPELRAAPAWTDGKKHLYHLRDTHFNARGNNVAGQALARFLAPMLKR